MDVMGNEAVRADCLVVGATGFIGRWLVAELLGQGRAVAVTVRGGAARGDGLRTWLREHGVDDHGLTVVDADIGGPVSRGVPLAGWAGRSERASGTNSGRSCATVRCTSSRASRTRSSTLPPASP